LVSPSQSSTDGPHVAENALDGFWNTYAGTLGTETKYWRANFEGGEKVVKEVKIRNRKFDTDDPMSRQLGGSKIFIGLDAQKGEICGEIPEETESGKEYIIKCKKNIKGKMIVIAGIKGRQLYVSEVVVISARNSEVN
jgi:hypothetical protein